MLDEQAAAGKEMMKLMGDLIAHLRDLLVYKVRPAALAEEAAPELQSSLGEEAALIETDRLLELIEQFAAAEGRMKWAPNKKLHFEVAVIKAIQTLSQVTLSEVIDNLAALRGGVSSAPALARAPAPNPVPQKKPAAPAPAPSPAPPPAAASSADIGAVWPKVIQLAYTRRPLLKTWLAVARLLGIEGRNVLLGFAPSDKTVMESLARPANRSFLEELLREVSGSDWTVKMSIEDGMPAAPTEQPAASEARKSSPNESGDSFKDDPLIKEALEIFKGEIKSVTT